MSSSTVNNFYDLIRGKKSIDQFLKSNKKNEIKNKRIRNRIIKSSIHPLEIIDDSDQKSDLKQSKIKKSNIIIPAPESKMQYPQFGSEYDMLKFRSVYDNWDDVFKKYGIPKGEEKI